MVIWLHDGMTVELSLAEAWEVYDRLRSLVPMPGALTALGRIRDMIDYTALPNPDVPLNAAESAAFTAAQQAGTHPPSAAL